MDDLLARMFHLQPSLLVTLTHDLMHAGMAILILIAGWWLSNRLGALLSKAMSRTHADPTLAPMINAIGTWTVRVLVLFAALSEVGVATASVLAVLGAAGLAIGLALQGTLQNIAAGIMLLMLRPFRAGDVIEGTGATAGIVREVGLFTTRIERSDGNAVFVPNSQIWSNPVINYSSGGTQRVEVKVDIAQRKDVACAIEALRKMITSDPRVLGGATLAPVVTAADHQRGGGAVVRVAVWVSGADAQLAADDMRDRARTVLEEAGCKTGDATRGQRMETMRARQSETPFA
ncbi:mechanosensitive ion channel MscS [Paraburkholderia hospita]|jgi:small-conductance mechanosensitive channel|uniref:Small-conductance mechanosensitive channel n=1 Tax=Paraburkholderia hospita TaxID=169430 RepID=A0ABN0FG18_9BURK|nr:mechanosensitive ion channel family protein [Paraburkholderia hospita]EUC18025.1 MscS Mechanosensitive ion channel [Burkholderia sp. BT03]SKC75395.1 Small-conductance mechanosensitive channel [Burkholderia sp. CF099]EIM97662.1 mechanosensitive ion channel MscS [Paraburkholderia hospita]OUL74916.1 mechanosensitive ion channel protein MscS [Paraburkholderia hospita]SKC90581.1 Small-conductance mechanosensitive channel [Paraburkholderia hospita]